MRYLKYVLGTLLIAILLFIGFKKFYLAKKSYTVISPKIENIKQVIYGIGNVDARDTYLVNPQVTAKILALNAKEGDFVKKGTLLAVLDSVDLSDILKEKELELKRLKSELDSAIEELKAAKAQKEFAYKTYLRYKNLLKSSYVSKEDYEKQKSNYKSLQANAASLKSKIESIKTRQASAKKAIEGAQKRLLLYKVYAPTDGYIISKNASIGEVAMPSKAIFTIVNPKDVWVKVFIDEKLSGNIKAGQKALIKLRSKPNWLQGSVAEIKLKSDPVTLEKEIDVAFKKVQIPFFMNEQAEVKIFAKEYKNVLTLPSAAIVGGKVWTVQDGKAHLKELKIIYNNGKKCAVEGLEKNSKVLLPIKGLKEGQSID